ncbi:MAG: sulfate ABC transporter substrate-binding protein [Actinomycetia bacterium]|nr:sulfate ABC transporter substrate-binding protein [Actinomycetes bacterium]
MRNTFKTSVAAAVASALTLGLSACGGASGAGDGDSLSIVGYSVPEVANKAIAAEWAKTDDGEGVSLETSYGASGDQSRAVESGLDADYVHFSLETDVTRLVDAGLVAKDWKDDEFGGSVSRSVVAFVVRKGNPKNIQGWDDLVKPGVEVITPNPGSSGSARWNILGAWGHVIAKGGTEEEAKEFVTKLIENTIALPGSGRDATTSFNSGNGDVLISYENEAILARQNGEEFDYVVPDDTLRIDNPGAVLEDASPKAEDWIEFVQSKQGQKQFAKYGYRPLVDVGDIEVEGANDPKNPFPEPKKLLTIDDFGGWDKAAAKFFDEQEGIIPAILAETGNR